MAALDRISRTAVALLEFVVGELGCEVDVSRHAPVLYLHTATAYETQRSTYLFIFIPSR